MRSGRASRATRRRDTRGGVLAGRGHCQREQIRHARRQEKENASVHISSP